MQSISIHFGIQVGNVQCIAKETGKYNNKNQNKQAQECRLKDMLI